MQKKSLLFFSFPNAWYLRDFNHRGQGFDSLSGSETFLLNSLTAGKTSFRVKRYGLSLVPTLLCTAGKDLFPCVGINHSQRGNVLFPTWELFDFMQILQNFLRRLDEKGQDLTFEILKLLIIRLLAKIKHFQDLT